MWELICASLHTSATRYGFDMATGADRNHSVSACVYTSRAAAHFWSVPESRGLSNTVASLVVWFSTACWTEHNVVGAVRG